MEKKKKIIYCNVFSNVGKLKKNIKLIRRKDKAIIFGNTYQKEILYKDILLNKKKYQILLKNMSVTEIIDIGPKIDISHKVNFIKINRIGIKSKNYISSLLKDSKVGLVFYPVSQMTKSGIVAAYASHGLVIINCCKEKVFRTNEFVSGKQYVSKNYKNINFNLQKIANESFKNYNNHGLDKTVSLIINNLKKN